MALDFLGQKLHSYHQSMGLAGEAEGNCIGPGSGEGRGGLSGWAFLLPFPLTFVFGLKEAKMTKCTGSIFLARTCDQVASVVSSPCDPIVAHQGPLSTGF